jgi:hypothetical protein
MLRRGELHTGCWWENLRERDNLEDPGIDRRITLRWIFKRWFQWAWAEYWLRMGTGGGHL